MYVCDNCMSILLVVGTPQTDTKQVLLNLPSRASLSFHFISFISSHWHFLGDFNIECTEKSHFIHVRVCVSEGGYG